MADIAERARVFQYLLQSICFEPVEGRKILDLGCGNGSLVSAFRQIGFDAYGCDFAFKEGPNVEKLIGRNLIRLIPSDRYELPFSSGSFDYVISDQVFEHVRDVNETAAELSRILRPEGCTVHIFPSRYTPLEPHVRIPLATVFQNRAWLRIWHSAGIGKPAGPDRSVGIVEQNYHYLQEFTHYRSHTEMNKLLEQHFPIVGSLEKEFIRLKSHDISILRFIPASFAALLYSIFRDRIIYMRKQMST